MSIIENVIRLVMSIVEKSQLITDVYEKKTPVDQ